MAETDKKKGPEGARNTPGPKTSLLVKGRQMIIFHYEALPVNQNFGKGILNPPAAVSTATPGRPVITEAVRTRDDEPSDADRIAHYFRDEISAANAVIEADAEEYAFLTALHNGRFHA